MLFSFLVQAMKSRRCWNQHQKAAKKNSKIPLSTSKHMRGSTLLHSSGSPIYRNPPMRNPLRQAEPSGVGLTRKMTVLPGSGWASMIHCPVSRLRNLRRRPVMHAKGPGPLKYQGSWPESPAALCSAWPHAEIREAAANPELAPSRSWR